MTKQTVNRNLYVVMPWWNNNDQDIEELIDSKEFCFYNFEQAKSKYLDEYYEKQSRSNDVRMLKVNATYNCENINIWEQDK